MRILLAIILLAIGLVANAADIDSLRTESQIALSAGETSVAIDKLQQIVALEPDDGATHYQIATLLMDNDGDLFDATHHFERARELNFQPLGVSYRLSRIFARSGRTAAALDQMEILANGGFGLLNLIEGQEDYASIQDEPRFVTAVEAITNSRFPCKADERRHAFDFWIGEWDVTANGQFAGTNSIQPTLGHCTLLEQWSSVSGTFGKSFNYYAPAEDEWRQIWIDDTGNMIEFAGKARDGGIFFTAETINPADGSVTLHKFEFTQIEDGVVRQYWETSADDGETWAAIWDGRYTRQAE